MVMMKEVPLSKAYRLIEPGPVVLVTTADKGCFNIMTMSFWIAPNLCTSRCESRINGYYRIFRLAWCRGVGPKTRCSVLRWCPIR